MDLSVVERLLIANQFRILEKLYPDEADYYSSNRKVLERGYKLHYGEIFESFYEEMSERECKEVIDILDMYRAITFSYRDLSDKDEIREEEIRFYGFDGNNEIRQYLYAKFFILELDRFNELTYGQKNPELNSHSQRIDKYKKMLIVWNSFNNSHSLTALQIKAILAA